MKNGALSSSARDNNSKVPDTPIMNPLYAAKLKEEQKAVSVCSLVQNDFHSIDNYCIIKGEGM